MGRPRTGWGRPGPGCFAPLPPPLCSQSWPWLVPGGVCAGVSDTVGVRACAVLPLRFCAPKLRSSFFLLAWFSWPGSDFLPRSSQHLTLLPIVFLRGFKQTHGFLVLSPSTPTTATETPPQRPAHLPQSALVARRASKQLSRTLCACPPSPLLFSVWPCVPFPWSSRDASRGGF